MISPFRIPLHCSVFVKFLVRLFGGLSAFWMKKYQLQSFSLSKKPWLINIPRYLCLVLTLSFDTYFSWLLAVGAHVFFSQHITHFISWQWDFVNEANCVECPDFYALEFGFSLCNQLNTTNSASIPIWTPHLDEIYTVAYFRPLVVTIQCSDNCLHNCRPRSNFTNFCCEVLCQWIQFCI